MKKVIFFAVLTMLFAHCKKNDVAKPTLAPVVTTVATGLTGPLGMELCDKGYIWVTQSGTGHNDGKVVVITPDGKVHTAIDCLTSFITDINEVEGPAHLLFADGFLYILGAKGMFLKANVSNYKPTDAPLNGHNLPAENIGAFVLGYNFVNNAHDTHIYGLTIGSDGAIYIADAAANAIIRRSKTGVLSVLAEIPGIPNPTPVGPPFIQSVPTSIIATSQGFLVTAFLGFPFPEGKSIVYKVSQSGIVSIYQQGFTSLIDIIPGGSYGYLALQHAVFGAMGFAPNTGKLLWLNGTATGDVVGGLNLPTSIKKVDDHTYYVTTLGDGGTVKKITF